MKTRMKKLWPWLLLLILATLTTAARATNIELADDNGNVLRYYYNGSNGDAAVQALVSVSADENLAGVVVVPATIVDGEGNVHAVSSISNSAFSDNTSLVSISLPSSITSIGSYAFKGTSISDIELPENLTTIGDYAFQQCKSLNYISIPDLVTAIGNYVFSGCERMNVAYIGSGVISLGNYAFQNCIRLTNVKGGENIVSIGSGAFQSTRLTEAYLPANVETIGNYAFRDIPTLETVKFGPKVKSISRNIFTYYSTDVLSATTWVFYGKYTTIPSSFLADLSNVTSITLGAQITDIGSYAFKGTGISEIELPENLATIGDYAFQSCTNLSSIVVPDQVTQIGSYAFEGCNSLATAVIGSQVQTIKSSAFQNCTSLTEVTGGANVTAINNYAFYNTRLTEAYLPANVETIGSYAFREIPTMTKVEFGPKVKSISKSIFTYYSSDVCNIERIVFNGTYTTIPNSFCTDMKKLKDVVIGEQITIIDSYAFQNLDSLRSISIPDAVVTINGYAFEKCNNLTTVHFGTGLRTIGSYAFSQCNNLSAIDLRDAVTTLNSYAFNQCTNLASATGLGAVETVGSYAFSYCTKLTELVLGTALTSWNLQGPYSYTSPSEYDLSGLKSITLPGSTIPFTSSSSTYGLRSGLLIYVPEDMLTTYRTNANLTHLRFIAIGSSTSFAVVTTDGGQLQEQVEAQTTADKVIELKITGPLNGTDIDYIHRYLTNIEKLDLEDAHIVNGGDSYHRWEHESNTSTQYGSSSYNTAMNTVGPYMFANLIGLTTLVLPADVTSIGVYAFADCRRLSSLTIPDGVTEIGNYAFSYSRGEYRVNVMKRLHLPTSLTTLGTYAFYCQKSLEEIEIPGSLETLPDYCFNNCSVKNVILNEGLKHIGTRAFYYSGVQTINLPTTLESMGTYAFTNSSLRGPITLPSALKIVPAYTFEGCESLNNVTFSEGLEEIQNEAFYSCKSLTQAILPQSLKKIGNHTFRHCYRMRNVTLPDALESLGTYAFSECDSMETFTFPETITTVPSYVLENCDKLSTINLASGVRCIMDYAFDYCKSLRHFDFDQYTKLTQIYGRSFSYTALEEAIVPDRVDTLFSGAFRNCKRLKRAKVPAGVNYVASSLFNSCDSLTEVTLHDGIVTINSSAFYNCKLLPTLELNDNITTIGQEAFVGCSILTLPNNLLPAGVKDINSYAFQDCKALKIESFPAGLTNVQASAFSGCLALTQANLPTGLKVLGNNAFSGSGIVSAVIPTGLTTLGTSVFRDCSQLVSVSWPTDQTKVPDCMFTSCKVLTDITLPDNVTDINYEAFFECNSLPTTFHFPTSLTKIGSEAFRRTYAFSDITLPISLREIGSYAFQGSWLRHIEIPDSVKTLGDYAFQACDSLRSATLGRSMNYTSNNYFNYFNGSDSLKTVRIYAGTPPTINSDYYIRDYYKNCVLEVPAGVDSLYRATNYWKDFKEIRTFLTGDKLAAEDYAILQILYQIWDGANWTHTWDLSTDDRFVGKWYGVEFNGDHISKINLTNNNLKGELSHYVFHLPELTSLDLGNNYLTGQLGEVLGANYYNDKITRIQLYGNQLEGDLYPFASKFSALTYLSVAYNQITEISQPIPKTTLSSVGNQLWYSRQFCDYKTHLPVVNEKYPSLQLRYGEDLGIEWNSLISYDHNSQNYNRDLSVLYRIYYHSTSTYSYGWTYDSYYLYKYSNDQWVAANNHIVRPVRGEPILLSPGASEAYETPIVVTLDWYDGDINADQTVDVTDLQHVVSYASSGSKLSGKVFNFTAADVIKDETIDVRDIVMNVNAILDFEEPTAPSGVRSHILNLDGGDDVADVRNLVAAEGNVLRMANADAVGALQLTLEGQVADDLRLAPELSGMAMTKRQIGDKTRVVIYDMNGRTIDAGEHDLLLGLDPQATLLDIRLSDAEANYLDVGIRDLVTRVADGLHVDGDMSVYDLSGRRIESLDKAPAGIYVIKQGNKQYKIRK